MYGQRLATLDPETGNRPSSRLGNAGNARQLVNRLKYEDETRMYRYTRIMGLLDGNPPWPQKKLVDLGQGHRANFNLRESEGIVDSAKTPYYDLIFEVPYFANIVLSADGVEPTVTKRWSDVMQQEYYETLCNWVGMDQNIQLHQWQLIVMGVGPLFWPHAVSWKSQATKARKVLVPQETMANVEELELCVVLHSWRADELDSYTSGAKSDNDEDYNGWNVPLVREAVIQSSVREMRQQWGIENYDLYQRAIRTGDLFYGIHRSDRVYVASIFVKEFGGKVSHYIITDTALGTAQETFDKVEEERGYIYKKKNKFDDFSQVIDPFFFDVGPDGTWHSVKGLGPKIYDFCDVSNRMTCQMLDGAVAGSGLILESQDGASLEETQMAFIGGATVVAPGYKVTQTRIAESLNGAMAMRRELQNTLQSNTGSYRQRPEESKPEPTLGQAQMNWQQQGTLTRGAINRYLTSFNLWHRETLRRLMDPAARNDNVPGGKEAKLFMERCIAGGVPEAVFSFRNVRKVTAVPAMGYGSPQLRSQSMGELLQLFPMLDEVGKNHALRAKISSLPGIGPSQVDSYVKPIEQQPLPNIHTAMATLENNALRQENGKVIVDPGQNHSIHFDVHDKDVQEHLQDPRAHPIEQLIHAEQAGQHMQKHLNGLEGDPTRKAEVKDKKKRLQALAKETDRLHQNVDEMMQARRNGNGQQPSGGAGGGGQPQPDPAMAKVQGDLRLKAVAQQGKHALKVQDQQFKEQLADKKAGADIRRQTVMERSRAARNRLRPGGNNP